MIRALILTFVFIGPALAQQAVDVDTARLQAAEAAVRAGVNSAAPVVRNTAPVGRPMTTPTGVAKPTARSTDGYFPLHRAAEREFPLPPRNESAPSGSGLQALIAAGNATPVPKETDKEAREARETAAGLQAIQDFRHNHGLQ